MNIYDINYVDLYNHIKKHMISTNSLTMGKMAFYNIIQSFLNIEPETRLSSSILDNIPPPANVTQKIFDILINVGAIIKTNHVDRGMRYANDYIYTLNDKKLINDLLSIGNLSYFLVGVSNDN